MKPLDLLRAFRAGDVSHDWADVTTAANGHTAVFRVSTRQALVRGNTESCGARGQQLLADAMGALLPTAKLLAERHRQATVKLEPVVGDVVHLTAEQWGERWHQALCRATGEAGQWLVSDCGKSWIVDPLCSPTVAVNEGFFVDAPGTWNGIAVAPTAAPGVCAIQERGARHGFAHDASGAGEQDDYSQHCLLVADRCVVDGADMATADVYASAELCALVSHVGPVPVRQPGVPPLADSAEWKALEAEVSQPPDTLTSLPRELATAVTPSTPTAVFGSLERVLSEWSATRATLLILLAQWSLETGRGRSMRCYNIGNIKGRIDGSAGDWQFFDCGENLPLAYANKLVAADPARVSIRAVVGGIADTRFVAPHPVTCFRAYESLDAGVRDYVALLQRRFPVAWERAVAGDARGFALALGAAGYFTAPAGPYADAVVRLAGEFSTSV